MYHEETRARFLNLEKMVTDELLWLAFFQNVADIPTVPAERVAFLFQRKATLELTQ
jgi:hypothetical protein